SPRPVVLDADGLNAFAAVGATTLAQHESPLVITPHPGEAARLLNLETKAVQADRLGAARRLAQISGGICVLKGKGTIVADPKGQAWINSTGGPALATGGTGDVLTGMIAGLIAQGLEPRE